MNYFLPILILVFTDIADIGEKYLSISVKKIHQYRLSTKCISVKCQRRYDIVDITVFDVADMCGYRFGNIGGHYRLVSVTDMYLMI